MKNKYVVEIGAPCIDEYYKWDHYPELGTNVWSEFIKAVPGGFTANAVSVLGSLGTESYCFCDLGKDQYTDLLIADFKNYNVGTNYIRVSDEFRTAVLKIMMVGPERLIIIPRYGNDKVIRHYTKEQLEKIKDAEYIYTVFNIFDQADNFDELLDIIKEHKIKIMFDGETTTFSSYEQVKDYIEIASIISLNEFAVEKLTGKEVSQAEDFIDREIIKDSDKIILLTLGKEGAIIKSKDERIVVPALDVEVKDTTGAGDTFNAAFLHYIIKEKSLLEAGEFAIAAANRAVTMVGARTGAVTEAEVLKFWQEYKAKNG